MYEGACTGWGDWGEINRNRRNIAEEGALCTYTRPTSARVGGVIRYRPMPHDLCIFDTQNISFRCVSVRKYKDSFTTHEYINRPI